MKIGKNETSKHSSKLNRTVTRSIIPGSGSGRIFNVNSDCQNSICIELGLAPVQSVLGNIVFSMIKKDSFITWGCSLNFK